MKITAAQSVFYIESNNERQHEKENKKMGFVKEIRRATEPFPEWEYLNGIGVRDMFGEPLKNFTTSLVVDHEKNYYLISQGVTNPNRDVTEIWFYALCLDGKVLNLEVEQKSKTNLKERIFECHWKIKKIDFPMDWTYDEISKEELKTIIQDAFTVNFSSKSFTLEQVKKVTVEILASLEVNIGGGAYK